MKVVHIPNQRAGVVSPLMVDYLEQSQDLRSCVEDWMTKGGLDSRLKSRCFSDASRKVLVKSLRNQYHGVTKLSELTQNNIEALSESNTFTVVTGHQLSLFTGPLYFLYKIITAINLAKELNVKHTNNQIVPVFWMATEDHDFEEIASVKVNNQKFTWNRSAEGATGRMSTEGLPELWSQIRSVLPPGTRSDQLNTWFSQYAKGENLTTATRQLVNDLFGEYGLVIIDGDDRDLKSLFIPQIKDELLVSKTQQCVEEQSHILKKKHKVQAYAREINLFYLTAYGRHRIEKSTGGYFLVDSPISFTQEELLSQVDSHPERFSPNVILRPVYQEVVLPNLAYIGGGGELAYWLQIKSNFERLQVDFPILWLRNSAGILSAPGNHHLLRMKISLEEALSDYDHAMRKWIEDHSETPLSLVQTEVGLQEVFEKLKRDVVKTHPSMQDAIEAEKTRQLKSVKRLEKKLLRAEKRQHSEALSHVDRFRDELLPTGTPQERVENLTLGFSTFGHEFISGLVDSLNPFSNEFTLLIDTKEQ